MTLKDSEMLVSFDVESLFTSIPVKEAISITMDSLKGDPTLVDRTSLHIADVRRMLEFCLNNAYFTFEGDLYLQTDGLTMGSPISPPVANLFMESFEQEALLTAPHPPRIWKRYVDDTFCVIDCDHLASFLTFLNNLRKDVITFTYEEETDGQIAFLDVLVKRKPDLSLDTTVFRKKTHTDQYLSFDSHHPESAKRSVLRSLFNRADSVPSNSVDREREKTHIQHALKLNNYPSKFVRDFTSRPPRTVTTDDSRPYATVILGLLKLFAKFFRKRICAYTSRRPTPFDNSWFIPKTPFQGRVYVSWALGRA